jgi:hypothetical protein
MDLQAKRRRSEGLVGWVGDRNGECFPAGSSTQCWPVSTSLAVGFVSLVLFLDNAKQCNRTRGRHTVESQSS